MAEVKLEDTFDIETCKGCGYTINGLWVSGEGRDCYHKPCYETYIKQSRPATKSDGSTASYYELPPGASELQDLISYKDMNAQVGESFRSLYRYGESSHSDKMRDAKKVMFYMQAEVERLRKYES